MLIIAHRCNMDGSNPATENTLATFEACLAKGYWIETDIRRWADGGFYISHDPRPVDPVFAAPAFLDCLRRHPGPGLALNVKELGYEPAMLDYLKTEGVADRLFLFDMELLEPHPGETARLLRRLDPAITLAARVSDRGETVEKALAIDVASVIWLDEFDSLWVTPDHVRALKAAGKTIHAISPEIHHFSEADMRKRWADFREWGVDGICTDHADALADFLRV